MKKIRLENKRNKLSRCVQVLVQPRVGPEGGPARVQGAVPVRLHQLLHEPRRVRRLQHPHAAPPPTGETTQRLHCHRPHLHHRHTPARTLHLRPQDGVTRGQTGQGGPRSES